MQGDASDAGDLIVTSQAAVMLGVSVATINRWAISGELEQAQQLPNGSRLFRRGVVRERAAQLAEEAEARAADLRAASA